MDRNYALCSVASTDHAVVMQSGELNRLSIYFDSDTKPWPMEKSWQELVPQDWNKVLFFLHIRLQCCRV